MLLGMSEPLYEKDFVRWAEQQAQAIRGAGAAGTNLPIDWENVAEEIDSLGRSQRTELRSRIRNIILHLMKLEASPAIGPRRGWEEAVLAQRDEIEGLLGDSPSLRQEVAGMIDWALPRACREISQNLPRWGERPRIDPNSIQYTESQVLGDWFPEHPAPVSRARAPRPRAQNT